MLLGLVLHSALTYNVTDHGDTWMLKDPNSTNIFTDFLVLIIHSFRIPIFFFVSGFFGAMLFYERGVILMIKNRISRILFPFIVFLILLWPFIVFVFGFTEAVFSQQENPLKIALTPLLDIANYIPQTTSHLWFLYYLCIITGITVVLALIMKKLNKINNLTADIFKWIIRRPIARVVFFSALTFYILSVLQTSMIEASVSLNPDFNTFLYFFFFYLIGWGLYKSKQYLITFIDYSWVLTILAVIMVIIKGVIIRRLELSLFSNSVILTFFSSVTVILFLFGITGLFIRYYSNYSIRMRYVSDSSYWVYLVHLPLTALIPSFIWGYDITVFGKHLIVITVTGLISFTSYHYLVRSTFIGKFLNGRKYPKRKIISK